MNTVVLVSFLFVAVVYFIQQAESKAIPNECTVSSNPSYRYCCPKKGTEPVKTNLKTAGSAKTSAEIKNAHKQVMKEIEDRAKDIPEGCYIRPSGGYCCT